MPKRCHPFSPSVVRHLFEKYASWPGTGQAAMLDFQYLLRGPPWSLWEMVPIYWKKSSCVTKFQISPPNQHHCIHQPLHHWVNQTAFFCHAESADISSNLCSFTAGCRKLFGPVQKCRLACESSRIQRGSGGCYKPFIASSGHSTKIK